MFFNGVTDRQFFSASPDKGRLITGFKVGPKLLPEVVSSGPKVKQRIEP